MMASSSTKSCCMNAVCGASSSSSSSEWKKGWPLRSGQFATLCHKCGSAYEQSIFCDVFHAEDSGWRECTSCAKRLHCGCIASRFFLEFLDGGGVNCISCAKIPGLNPVVGDDRRWMKVGSVSVDNQLGCGFVDKLKLLQAGSSAEGIGLRNLFQFQGDDGQMKQEEMLLLSGENGSASFSKLYQTSNGPTHDANSGIMGGAKDLFESLTHTNLSISLGGPSQNLNSFPGDERGYNNQIQSSSIFQQGHNRSRHLLPKPPKPALVPSLETNASQIRVARPPAEGRGRSQLLPRYWPRITDQELQQISGDPNSTIVPLFEKVLSASDAGRIGRLVLPKACAEAYFPPISQPEGLPIRIQDIKGKEWVFQFRFWPNNNSRMYVLEGVTPCIQSMQLQAGDTVTFSRKDPEGKLVMGFRKASSSAGIQDTQPPAILNGLHSSESFFSGVFENLPIISGYSGLLQSLKGTADPHLNALSRHMTSPSGVLNWQKYDERTRDGLLLPSMLVPERKKARNIGTKSKRLLVDSLDVLELRLTWEETQDLLRPPPSVKPSIVTIEDHDIEEYEEPPVFGKRSIFLAHSTGGQEQWVQCDSCSKWRRLSIDVLLPANWTCVDNTWDQNRCSCSAPNELPPRELENIRRLNNDFKRQRMGPNQENVATGLDTLANASILEDNVGDPGTTCVATTTRHPRHRPGCSCIVCIQPPSGKGKHMPTCTCNVCLTVKRRFKTLMMRKKKRQSEREAEIALRNNQDLWNLKEEVEVDSTTKHNVSLQLDPPENEARPTSELELKSQTDNLVDKLAETSKGQLDLNCQPNREEEMQAGINRVSMMSLLHVASQPLEMYLKQNGLTSLTSEQQMNSPYAMEDSEGQLNKDQSSASPSAVQDREDGGIENCDPVQDQTVNNPE